MVDGEMPVLTLRTRLAQLALGDPRAINPEDARLRFLAADMYPTRCPPSRQSGGSASLKTISRARSS